MSEGAFPSSLISGSVSEKLVSMMNAPVEASFSDLVNIGGINPSTDLRFSDLRGVDLSNSDLRGYDFTGSDLRGAGGINVVFDSTTVTVDADVDGSIFATRERMGRRVLKNREVFEIAKKLSKESWSDQVIWCNRNFISSSKYYAISSDVATFLYQNTNSKYTKSQLISLISNSLNGYDKLNFLLSAISQDNDTIVSRFALEQVISSKFGDHPAAQTAAFRLISSGRSQTRISALKLLVRFSRSVDDFSRISDLVKGNRFLETAYVSEIAATLSLSFRLVTRDPQTNESFSTNENVDKLRLRRIAVRWLNAEENVRRSRGQYSILDMPNSILNLHFEGILRREGVIREMWKSLRRYGILFQIP